jgi:hypothetical protein
VQFLSLAMVTLHKASFHFDAHTGGTGVSAAGQADRLLTPSARKGSFLPSFALI